jgi:hypothetical protein
MRVSLFRLFLLALILTFGLTLILAQDNQQAARAQEILKQALEALGGEANLKAVRSLSASGKFSGAMGGRLMEGELNLDLLLPDKYLRTIKLSMGPMNITRIEAVNGEQVWMDMKRGAGIGGILGGMGGGGMGGGRRGGGMGMPGGGGRGAGAGGPSGGGRGGDGPMGGMQEMNSPAMQEQVRADFTRLLIAWLLTAPASSQVEFTYEQELETQDGKAHALRVTVDNDFTMALYLDQQTHRPVMLAYRALMPRRSAGLRSEEEPSDRSREPELVDVQLYISDYKAVGKVFLPHRVVKTSDGQTVEEWEIKKYKLNPDLKPKKFERRS